MNNLNDQKRELSYQFSGYTDLNRMHQLRESLKSYINDLKYYAGRGEVDRDTLAFYQIELARFGLEISQYLIPTLNEISGECLNAGGKDAVRTICAPMVFDGTGHDGKPIPPRPSKYQLPAEFEPIATKVARKAVTAAVAVGGLITALVGIGATRS